MVAMGYDWGNGKREPEMPVTKIYIRHYVTRSPVGVQTVLCANAPAEPGLLVTERADGGVTCIYCLEKLYRTSSAEQPTAPSDPKR